MTATAADIARAVAVLREGGLVAFPTETVYGLGADASNATAVRRMYAVKGRPAGHPVIVHVPSVDSLDAWATDVPEDARKLAKAFWPGPLTLILKRSARVVDAATAGLPTVGLRVPDHPIATALLEAFGGGIAAPSANRFGSVSPTTAAHVVADLGPAVDLVLDGGPCRVGVESTIVDLSGAEATLLRPGGVSREALEDVLGRPLHRHDGQAVRAPGMLASHYAPRARVVLTSPAELATTAAALLAEGERVGALATDDDVLPEGAERIVLPVTAEEAAARLYAALREADERGLTVLLATLPPEQGLGLAVADRLRRAAGPRT